MAEPVFIDEIIKKVVHNLFTLRNATNRQDKRFGRSKCARRERSHGWLCILSVVFTSLTNQQSAIQSVNLHPHPWGW